MILTGLEICSSLWLSYWSDSGPNPEYSTDFYFKVYICLSLSYGVSCFFRNGALSLQSLRSSKQVHKEMITKVIRAPVNLFFDRIPAGRLLNRFSKDLKKVDTSISGSINFVLWSFFILLSTFTVCMLVGSVWVTPLIILFGYAAVKLQRKYTRVNREVTRLCKLLLKIMT